MGKRVTEGCSCWKSYLVSEPWMRHTSGTSFHILDRSGCQWHAMPREAWGSLRHWKCRSTRHNGVSGRSQGDDAGAACSLLTQSSGHKLTFVLSSRAGQNFWDLNFQTQNLLYLTWPSPQRYSGLQWPLKFWGVIWQKDSLVLGWSGQKTPWCWLSPGTKESFAQITPLKENTFKHTLKAILTLSMAS